MLFFIILLIVGLVIWANWHCAHIIQQCDNYIKLIDTGDNAKNINKIPECVAFWEKNWTKIHKKAQTDRQYRDKFGRFLISLSMFMEYKIHDKKDFTYRKQLSDVLTHTVKDKDLRKQIITEIKNSKYIPKIENNEEDHFTYNLLNHYVQKGNPVDWEYVAIEYPDVFKNINSLSLQYLKENTYITKSILSNLHDIGKNFAENNEFFTVVEDIIPYIYPKEPMAILKYLKNKKVITSEQAENYQNQYDEYEDILKNNHKNSDETWKKRDELQQELYYEYICYIVKNGDIDEYVWLSEKIGWLLFRVYSPGNRRYLDRSKDDRLNAHKKMLDANTYGIHPLLLFAPKTFEEDRYKTKLYTIETGESLEVSVSVTYILKFKQDIDTILSVCYHVPNFLNHAREILDAYITGNTPFEKLSYDAKWHNSYDRKLDEIQLQTLSPYEIFGYTVGYLTCCVDKKRRIPAKYLPIKDSAFIAYLDSLYDSEFDNTCNLYNTLNNMCETIYRY